MEDQNKKSKKNNMFRTVCEVCGPLGKWGSEEQADKESDNHLSKLENKFHVVDVVRREQKHITIDNISEDNISKARGKIYKAVCETDGPLSDWTTEAQADEAVDKHYKIPKNKYHVVDVVIRHSI